MAVLLRVLVAITCLLTGVSPLFAEPTMLTLEQQRARAGQALAEGDPALSVALAERVLSYNPRDFQTLYVLSLAHSQLGQNEAAANVAQRAFRAGKTNNEKLQAARIVAAAKFRDGQFTRAEWWLRRGANYAKTPEDAAIVAQEFQAIRQQNPLSMRFGFSIAPSNNINGGTEDTTFNLGDFQFIFDPSSLALSGVEYSGDVELSYRLSQSPNHITQAGLYLYGRTFSLSSASQATVPNVSGSDYALGLVELSLSHRRLLFDGLGPSGISLHTGQVWYSGNPLWRYNKLSVSQDFPIGHTASATIQASVEDQTGLDIIQPDSTVLVLQGSYARRIANQDVIRLSIRTLLNNATIATNTYTDQLATLSYELDKPVFGSSLSVSLGVGAKTYDEFSLSLDGRRDRYVTLGATAVFEQVSYFGFSPSWSLSTTLTDSNVTRFSMNEVTARFGIQSKF